MPKDLPLSPDDFAAYYSFAPAALALRECIRLDAVRRFDLTEPILDVGCGDGLFARLAYPGKQSWGVDINPAEVQRAQATASYSTLICGSITNVDLPQGFFGSAIANCSLEHVPDLGAALATIGRALRPGASFVLIVPTPDWVRQLALPRVLRKMGLPALARAYGATLDDVFSHIHLYDEAEWRTQLDRAGFVDVRCEQIVSAQASAAFDLLLYPSLVALVTKKLTGRWVLAPRLRALTADLARMVANGIGSVVPSGPDEGAGEFVLICRKPSAQEA